MSNERLLIEFLNEKYSTMPELTNEQKACIETGVMYGVTFVAQLMGSVRYQDILSQYEQDNIPVQR